eukprot:SAG31_NODE_35261_length_324_cov_5.226667_1_plen_32_part_10
MELPILAALRFQSKLDRIDILAIHSLQYPKYW